MYLLIWKNGYITWKKAVIVVYLMQGQTGLCARVPMPHGSPKVHGPLDLTHACDILAYMGPGPLQPLDGTAPFSTPVRLWFDAKIGLI